MLSLLTAIKNALLDTYGANFNSGTIELYSGSVPADCNAALGAAVLMGTGTFGATAFAAAAAGSMSANPITQDGAADASGPASFYRARKSGAGTYIEQGAVGQLATGGTCSFATNQMTIVTPPTNGGYRPGGVQAISAAGVAAGTTITALVSGVANQAGAVYSLSTSPGTIAAEAVSAGYGELQLNNIDIVAGGPIQFGTFTRTL